MFISSPAQVLPVRIKLLEAGADGAIAGSAVAQVITENLSNVPVMLERLTAFVKEMKAAAALS